MLLDSNLNQTTNNHFSKVSKSRVNATNQSQRRTLKQSGPITISDTGSAAASRDQG